ncbi:glycerate kinase [Actinomyces viscosus]|uniref:Glycerate kinase I n=1 Tax=Actinomyces viscosus TaxID=1656 RepID=A0A3S4VDD1_ACTVI|nr:glycerate kinase [Actinomyces viscosus]TFH52260.1 glycerate kinase [Actinomyces viscosus]VEI15065.1 glycerate kinase I [Actinomyces viscosus]
MKVLLAPGGLWPEPAGVPLAGPGRGLPASSVAACLERGWHAVRPDDSLTLVPMADGGPGSAQVIAPERIASREAIQGQGPLGQVREVDLVRLGPGPARSAAQRPGEGRTWFLDAARLLAPPLDPDESAQEARHGSTYGLGQVIGTALGRTSPSDTLVVGLSRSAVHDGGAGALDALGGAPAAMDLLVGRSLGLALADGIALGGMSGAGAALAEITSLSPAQAQELDRRACAAATEAVSAAATPRPSFGGQQRLLPVVSALDDAQMPSLSAANSRGTGHLSTTTWGTGAAGGGAMALRALGAWARPGARVMAEILGLSDTVLGQDMVVTASGELYDVLADGVVDVVGDLAASQALPAVLVCGRCATTRGELAGAGISSVYSLQEPHAIEPWDAGGPDVLEARLTDMGGRLARTWSR